MEVEQCRIQNPRFGFSNMKTGQCNYLICGAWFLGVNLGSTTFVLLWLTLLYSCLVEHVILPPSKKLLIHYIITLIHSKNKYDIEYYLFMKHAWDEIALNETFKYLPFKLLLNMFDRIFIKGIAFCTATTHLILRKKKLSCCTSNLSYIADFSVFYTNIP